MVRTSRNTIGTKYSFGGDYRAASSNARRLLLSQLSGITGTGPGADSSQHPCRLFVAIQAAKVQAELCLNIEWHSFFEKVANHIGSPKDRSSCKNGHPLRLIESQSLLAAAQGPFPDSLAPIALPDRYYRMRRRYAAEQGCAARQLPSSSCRCGTGCRSRTAGRSPGGIPVSKAFEPNATKCSKDCIHLNG